MRAEAVKFDKGYIPVAYIIHSYLSEIETFKTTSPYFYHNISNKSKYALNFNGNTGFIQKQGLLQLYSPIGEGYIVCVKEEDVLLFKLRLLNNKIYNPSQVYHDSVLSHLLIQFYTADKYAIPSIKNKKKVRHLFDYYSFNLINVETKSIPTYLTQGLVIE